MQWPKTTVVGIDGAHFELIDPWIEEGRLPNIARIVDDGITADLESVLPPVTSPNWKSYATGRNPGQFGIFWWENIDVDSRRVYYPSERKHRHPEFWEFIADDERVGVLGVPTTYPPKPVDSFFVAGAPDAEESGFAHPSSVETVLRDEMGYRVVKEYSVKHDPEKAGEEILDLIDSRFRAAKRLQRDHEVSFLQITTFYINVLHHYYWDDEYSRRGWEIIDGHLGDFLSGDGNVVIMSDHGSNEIETVFHVNTWLEREGYLHLDMFVPSMLERFGLTSETLNRYATRLGIKELALKLTPTQLRSQIPNASGELGRESKTDNIDWDRSVAVASGQGPIYLTVDRESRRYEDLRTEIIEKLRDMRDPRGNRIANEVHRGEDVYAGEYLEEAPDIVIDQAKAVHIPGGIGRDRVFTEPSEGNWRAENKRHGIFAALGPDFATGRLEGLSILDLAPTILHLHGCSIPRALDGSVRPDVFSDGSEASSREPAYRAIEETDGTERRSADEDLQSRLSDLGYIE